MTGIIDAHGHLGAWFAFAIPDSSTASLVRVMDGCGVATMCVSHLLAIGPDSRAGNALLLRMTVRHLAWLVDAVGADRMAFGSDALFLDLRVRVGRCSSRRSLSPTETRCCSAR